MPFDFSLSDLESSPKYKAAPYEVRQQLSRRYLEENGEQDALDQFEQLTASPKFSALPEEEQTNIQDTYREFYGLKQPDVSLATDVAVVESLSYCFERIP